MAQKWPKITQNCPNWTKNTKIAKDDPKWTKNTKIAKNDPKIAKKHRYICSICNFLHLCLEFHLILHSFATKNQGILRVAKNSLDSWNSSGFHSWVWRAKFAMTK